jgi:hypothetical protein
MKVYIDFDKFSDIILMLEYDDDYNEFRTHPEGYTIEPDSYDMDIVKAFIKLKYKIIYNERWLPGLELKKERSLYGTKKRITMFLLRL